MKITTLTNRDKKFYSLIGKIFGSRLIERETKDRIYDDDDKEWYVVVQLKEVVAFVSVKNRKIKNLFCFQGHEQVLEFILEYLYPSILDGIVTKKYYELYKKCGYIVSEYQSNFVKIQGGYTRNEEHK